MIVAIHQPNYIPWLGFFNKMARSDTFVLFDDVQLVRGKSFVTRNRVKTANGVQWLTVPVKGKSELNPIRDVMIARDREWQRKHWRTIQLSYKKASYFDRYEAEFGKIYGTSWEKMSDLNIRLIELIKGLVGIKATLVLSSEMDIEARGAEKIISIVKELKADRYLTGEGQGSKRYITEEEFQKNGIKLIYQRFEHPKYKQLWGDFIPNLSIIDLLFNEGEKTLEILMEANS